MSNKEKLSEYAEAVKKCRTTEAAFDFTLDFVAENAIPADEIEPYIPETVKSFTVPPIMDILRSDPEHPAE